MPGMFGALAWRVDPVRAMEFEISADDLGGGVASVTVGGEVDLHTAPALKTALAEVIDRGGREVLVDLSRATFIDSTTLGVLMGAVKRLRPAGGEVAIACSDPNVRKVFAITLLDRIFEIFPSSEEALRHLRARAATQALSSN